MKKTGCLFLTTKPRMNSRARHLYARPSDTHNQNELVLHRCLWPGFRAWNQNWRFVWFACRSNWTCRRLHWETRLPEWCFERFNLNSEHFLVITRGEPSLPASTASLKARSTSRLMALGEGNTSETNWDTIVTWPWMGIFRTKLTAWGGKNEEELLHEITLSFVDMGDNSNKGI